MVFCKAQWGLSLDRMFHVWHPVSLDWYLRTLQRSLTKFLLNFFLAVFSSFWHLQDIVLEIVLFRVANLNQ